MIESSKDLFFLSLVPDRINFEEERVMLWAFSGIFRATIDMLRESRRPSLRVRSDMELVKPRLRVSLSVAQLAVEFSSTPPPSSLSPAISLIQWTPPGNSFMSTFTSSPCHSTEPSLSHLFSLTKAHFKCWSTSWHRTGTEDQCSLDGSDTDHMVTKPVSAQSVDAIWDVQTYSVKTNDPCSNVLM